MESKIAEKKNLISISRPIDVLFALEVCKTYPKLSFLMLVYPHNNEQEKKLYTFYMRSLEKIFRMHVLNSLPPFKKDLLNH